MRIIPSNICTALEPDVIGSKVTNPARFMLALNEAVAAHNFNSNHVPGQALIQLPAGIPFVSCGVGQPVHEPDAYVLKLYRGKVSAYLKREHAAQVESLACVVYTKDAYLRDPDVTMDEQARVQVESVGWPVTHVLVAVLASAGAQSQLSPYRFVHNLAGGNHEAKLWSADEIRTKAKEILEHAEQWETVADG
jgi:hypothetical protein